MTSHYEERMEADLTEIRGKVRKASALIEDQVRKAVHALLTDDRDLANEVILGDRRVNRKIREIDHLCHAFIVRHAPSAGHLRFVSAVLRLDVALERIGDYAGTIGREVVQLSGPPPGTVARDIELISHQARRTLRQALTAFHEADVELAQATHGAADQTDSTLQKVFAELLDVGEKRELPLRDIFGLLRIINLLKRVAEQAENICEQTVFAITGDTGDAKVYRILFLDRRNDCGSLIAEAYARKAFPQSGIYTSSGWDPAPDVDPKLVQFLDASGIDMKGLKPSLLRPIQEEPRHFHVIVALDPEARAHIGTIPFRTVCLEWDVGDCGDFSEARLDQLLKTIAIHVQDLMTILRGSNAR